MTARVATRVIALATAALSVAGCGSPRSRYARQAAMPGELVWRYADDRLQVTRNGEVISEGGEWERLASAVACVPRANAWATEATSRYRTGRTMFWGGMIGMLAGTVGGAALIVTDDDIGAQGWAGLGVMLTSLVGGVTVSLSGAIRQASAHAKGVDAVNVYNDQLWMGTACQ